MDKNQIHAKLTTVFRDVFDNDRLEIQDSTTAADVEGWDSLNHVNLIVSVEKSFGIAFSTKEVKSMRNVGEFIGIIQLKMQR